MSAAPFPTEIALIDDEAVMAALLQAIVEPARIAVRAFTSAAEALACPQLGAFEVLLLDLSLPDLSGLALVEAVARAAPRAHLVIVSGHERDVLVAAKWHARLCGVRRCDVLAKPFTGDEVLQLLRSPDAALAAPA